jgi:hypothetical protein
MVSRLGHPDGVGAARRLWRYGFERGFGAALRRAGAQRLSAATSSGCCAVPANCLCVLVAHSAGYQHCSPLPGVCVPLVAYLKKTDRGPVNSPSPGVVETLPQPLFICTGKHSVRSRLIGKICFTLEG